MTTLDEIKEKASEVFDESPYNNWEDVFNEFDGESVDSEFVEEHRWFSLFYETWKVGENYFRVPVESSNGDGEYDQEYDPDDVVQVYPVTVTITKYTTERS